MLDTGYSEDFCLAPLITGKQFAVGNNFISRLMEAGFLVMSMEYKISSGGSIFILLPKLHLERSVLFFRDLHIKRSILPFIPKYELHVNTDFNLILNKCIEVHGVDWLTPPIVKILKRMNKTNIAGRKIMAVKPFSFSLYRDGELKAGEFGIAAGRVYTSYSGYYEESNAGTVQIILMVQWLEKNGFSFFDFGMPLDYKSDLGARNIDPRSFVELFRAAR